MLKKLRIGPKLLLAPGLVLVLLLMLSGAAYYGMVRQNASLENMVQVRAARLKEVADTAGDAKYVHANAYQLLAWVSGSFAKSRLDALVADIMRAMPPSDPPGALARVTADPPNASRSTPRWRRWRPTARRCRKPSRWRRSTSRSPPIRCRRRKRNSAS
jgi:hypothetical protein